VKNVSDQKNVVTPKAKPNPALPTLKTLRIKSLAYSPGIRGAAKPNLPPRFQAKKVENITKTVAEMTDKSARFTNATSLYLGAD
jgi:hypothetical protein